MANKNEPMDQRELETLQYYLKEYGQQAEIFARQAGTYGKWPDGSPCRD